MGELSRHSSRQPLLQTDNTTSLTSFPDPSTSALPEETQSLKEPLTALLDQNGPSIFDEDATFNVQDPQSLSAASATVLQQVVDHHGAVELVKRLSTALAQRDAHITALRRLAEEYKIPASVVDATASRAQQAEDRRLSLAQASETLVTPSRRQSDSGESQAVSSVQDVFGAAKGLTRLFGGTGKTKPASISSRSTSRPPRALDPRHERHKSIDTQSLHSVRSNESTTWTAGLFGTSLPKRHDSTTGRAPVEMTTRHDKDHLPPTLAQQPTNQQEVAWNKYLRRLEEIRQQNKQDMNGGELIGAARFGQEGKDGQKKLDALKLLIIGGIPMHLRHQIWMELSDTRAIMVPDEYSTYLDQKSMVEENEVDTILKDVSRTMTTLNDFFIDKGFQKLQNVLLAFVGKYKDLGYTQGLNTIAGCLLLAIPSEEDAFWTLCNVVENSFPVNYFSRADSMILPLADSTLLEKYIQQLLPRLGNHLKKIGFGETHPITVKWFFTAFSNTLNVPVLMRVWDVWLCMPNQKYFLFSFALALLAYNTEGLIRCEDSGDFLAYLDSELKIPEDDDLTELLKEALKLSKKLGDVGERRSEEASFLRLESKLQRRRTGSMEAMVGEDDDTASEISAR